MARALSKRDPSSFSNPEECVIKHLDITFKIDFDREVIAGKVILDVERIISATRTLILDTRDIKIFSVTDIALAKELNYVLDEPLLSFGSRLSIELGSLENNRQKICIQYETSPNCTALQWLKPEQTAGKIHPYLFSQCQAIHARSLLPCQDTPGVKMPYDAKVSVPSALTALMSAICQGSQPCVDDPSRTEHTFKQAIPVPSYLIAVVAGALVNRQIGPRSKVWSEQEMIEAAAYEFAETETMLAIAEDLLTEYVWGVYDLLVLPPSFPYGGMENPCLTFVTPTLLAGDRTLASVVAHEIAHSWTGNLVTNQSPEDFWLNEGHTVFVERKICGRMYGEKFSQFAAIGGWKELQYQIDVFGESHPYTHLVPDLVGVDPDDAFSTVPYEKGCNLLVYLEQKLGGPEVFEPFLKAYIENFKFQSITTSDWKTFLYKFFKDKESLLNEVDWDTWFYKPGMPPVKPNYDSSLADACSALVRRWQACREDAELEDFSAVDVDAMSSFQLKELLAQLLEQSPLHHKKIMKMKDVYKFDTYTNCEIKFRWIRLCLRAKIQETVTSALKFVNEQGRMKFVRPIYRDMFNWDWSKEMAIKNYQLNSASMHTLTATMVGKDLQLI